ncbi:MAG: ROK family protein [Rhodothermales bacterium]|nr:ROK family protein [Rhodothermales bacterium]
MILGIEIGGTKLQLGVGSGDSPKLAEVVRRPVDRGAGAAGILDQITEAGSRLISAHRVDRVGIGFGGPIDMSTGVIYKSMQVSGWRGFRLTDWSERVLGLPTAVGNDCDVAALAEATHGAGHGRGIVSYVTVGTGVGGGLVVDGRLHGRTRIARAEMGQMRPGLDAHAPDMTVESMAAGPGIESSFRRHYEVSPDDPRVRSLMQEVGEDYPDRITAKKIASAARNGDPLAVEIFDRATRALGWAIAQVITLVASEVVVIGGGVSLAGDEIFFDPIRRYVADYVFPPFLDTYEIVPAALGEEVVVHGAIALAGDGLPLRRE